ncbi:hypothetical protein CR152_11535 [Massilia violaceinigra]|uniref:Uncharacterized protein n=1 Tax=Massilia violaceinigra TaxID=2045208 RepID=A0A2D2DJC3_9BURK|nr:hypothetical protein [Massilia violaceinigra]ATQ75083.1 hypothetical protein CR152_11535 [Massilia violaceinigra]
MAVTKIKAIDQFSHGRLSMAAGDTDTIELVEAHELAKAGLVEIVKERHTPAEASEPTPQAEAADSRDAGAKMAAAPENKMDDAALNKTHKSKAK